MPGSFKAAAIVVLILAVTFTCLFFAAKHTPALTEVNPFANDPYDAVGSAAIQFAVFATLLSGLRAFRPYPANRPPAGGLTLILRGWTVSLSAVAVALAADAIALGRNRPAWAASPGGLWLAGLTAGLAVLTAYVGAWLAALARRTGQPWHAGWPIRARVIVIAGLLILGLYPPDTGQTVAGALLTAALGLALLPLMAWGIAAAFFPAGDSKLEDILDDAVAISEWFLGGRLNALWATGWPARLSWLNPRRHRWASAILAALAAGLLLAAIQIMGEGLPPSRRALALVVMVFIGGEVLAVLLGYALFGGYLAIVRADEQA